jgi:hypothetical protein
VNKRRTAESSEPRDVRLVARPSFVRCGGFKGAGGRYIVEEGGIMESVEPVRLREPSVDEHCTDPVKQCPIHALRYTVVLRRVRSGHLVGDPLAL